MPSRHARDRDLVARAGAGDATAMAELYRRHAGAAHRVAEAVTQNPHDAADAVSESFARVLDALRAGRLGTEVHFRAYLVTSSRHAAIDLVRAAERTRPTERLEDLDGAAPGPADGVLAAADAALVGMAFRGLSERWRRVLWLIEVDGLAPRHAGAVLGLSPNGTAQLAVRARAALRSRYRASLLEAAPRAAPRDHRTPEKP